MSTVKFHFLTLAVISSILISCSGPTEKRDPNPPVADADNTARNQADSDAATQTPLDQGENPKDLEISATIRKAIVADDSLSSNAHNVKIITSGGMVTLRGPVKSEQEKATIESKAKEVAGPSHVQTFLEVENKP